MNQLHIVKFSYAPPVCEVIKLETKGKLAGPQINVSSPRGFNYQYIDPEHPSEELYTW